MHDNGMSAERLRAGATFDHAMSAGSGDYEIPDPPNSPASNGITYFARSTIVIGTPPANANTSSLLRPRMPVSSALSKKAASSRPAFRASHSPGCERYSEGATNSKRTPGWRPPRATAKAAVRASGACREGKQRGGAGVRRRISAFSRDAKYWAAFRNIPASG
jgi:hypothetical protein